MTHKPDRALDLAGVAVLRDFAAKIEQGVFTVLKLDADDSPDTVGVRVVLAEPDKVEEADPSVEGFICPRCGNADLRRLAPNEDGSIGCLACKSEFRRSD